MISGDKAWVTNASDAGWLNLYAQTDPALGHRGIVSIVVDTDSPGGERLPGYELMGAHARGTGGFHFTDVGVPVENTLIPPSSRRRQRRAHCSPRQEVRRSGCQGSHRRLLQVLGAAGYKRSDENPLPRHLWSTTT